MTAPIDVTAPETTTGIELVLAGEEELDRPYRVIIENDDVTPMEFVILVLLSIFELSIEQAESVMLQAHHNGEAYVATLPYEQAWNRVYSAHSAARAAGYPLSFYLEPEA